MATIVRTQAELNSALAALNGKWGEIEIRSERGVWLTVRATGSATVTAYGSATVTAYGSATVRATGSATVTAYGSATVTAYDSATVRATGSATVTAYGSATVRATGSATVTAYGSATVTASGSATVTAYGSATVTATGSATVRAYGSATVTAYDSATVTATPHVAVHLHSSRVTIEGGVVIDVTDINSNAEKWLSHHGVEVSDGKAILYKAVDDQLLSSYAFKYPIGETVTDKKWRDDHDCGGGLHFCPLPVQALSYFEDATRFLACEVALEDIRVIGDIGPAKCKTRTARVLHEVDIDGNAVVTA